MKVSRITGMIVLAAAFCLCASAAFAAVFPGGTGTEADPYIITTAAELDAVREDLSAHYKLGNDIDLTAYLAPGGAGYEKWTVAGWQPFKNAIGGFSGGFDGDWHKITGLWINRNGDDNVGLFGNITNATVQNVGVEISTDGVSGHNYVGGLVGQASFTTAYSSNITNCYVTGNVSGNNDVGGLVGWLFGSNIANCYATGDVSGNNEVGGLAGLVSGLITDSYATGNVRGNTYVGGLVGDLSYLDDSIVDCYFMGNVSGSDAVGGLVGYQTQGIREDGIVTNSYRYELATVNGTALTVDAPDGEHGGIVTAAQLTSQATYTTLTSWIFNSFSWHWDDRGFPKLNIGAEAYPFPFDAATAPEAFTVTLNSQGGSAVASIPNVQPGARIARPADPVREGYTFNGWYRDAAATQPWNFEADTVTGNLTLYAGWQANPGQQPGSFTVTFDSRGGSAVASIPNVQSGARIARPAEPMRDGYTFDGWYRDAAATQPWNFVTDTVTGNLTLYAGWRQQASLPGGNGSDEGGSGCSAGLPGFALLALSVLGAAKIFKR